MFRYIMSALALAALISILSMSTLRAHEGHDDAAKLPAASVSASPRGEAHSEKFELVVVAQAGALMIYLDDYRTNTPIEKASVEIETPDGPKTAMPVGNGTYRLDAPFLASGGHLDLIVTVTVGDSNDILPLSIDIPEAPATAAKPVFGWFETFAHSPWATGLAGFVLGGALVSMLRRRRPAALAAGLIAFAFIGADPVRAHEGHDDAPKPAQAASDQRAQRQPDGSVFVPKPIQRIFGLRTILTRGRQLRAHGRIARPHHSRSECQRLCADRGWRQCCRRRPAAFPRLGTPVKKGDVLAYVTPPIAAIDVSDMRQKQGELDQQISIVQRRLARQELLVTTGAVARTQFEDTRLELEGLRDRRAALDTIRREPVPLVAPVTGVIAEGTPITGQIAQSNAVVFHIVTPDRLWVEALSFDAVAGSGRASAKTGNGNAACARVPWLRTRRPQPVDPGAFLRSKATPKGLRAGQFVTVFTETRRGRVRASRCRALRWCAPPTARNSCSSIPARSASSRGRCGPSRSMRSAC